jgi:hypothetical protein
MVKKKEEGRSVTLGDALSELLATDKEAKAEQMAAAKQAGPAAQQQPEFVYTAVERPFIDRLRILIPEAVKNVIEEGHALFDLRAFGRKDGNKYSVVLPGKTEPENVGRFDAVINSFGLARASAYRYVRAYEKYLKASNPVPAAVTQMATSNGVLDPTTEIAKEALADAFLAAGQPSSPTPQQCMAIVADACERALQVPSDALAKFQTLLSKAVEFAKENNLEPEVIHGSLESAIAASFGMPGARVTREKAPIYNQNSECSAA